MLRWVGAAPVAPRIFITGGAGFGRSTLLVTWASRLREAVAWLTLDREDADPLLFAVNLVRSIERVMPGLWRGAAALLDRIAPPVPDRLGRALAGRSGTGMDLIVITDDAHHLGAGEAVKVLDGLLARPPAAFNLVLAGWPASVPGTIVSDGAISLLHEPQELVIRFHHSFMTRNPDDRDSLPATVSGARIILFGEGRPGWQDRDRAAGR